MLINDVDRLYGENLRKLVTINYIRQDGGRIKTGPIRYSKKCVVDINF